MKKFWGILKRILLALLLLLLALWILIQMPFFQNWLAHSAAKRISKSLRTNVSIKSASIGFFNKLDLEGVYIEDQNRDTLLSAGMLRVNITDWFFLADSADLKYVKLKDARVNLYRRTDSVWNYQFLADYFKTDKPKKKSQAGIAIHLKVLDLENVRIEQKDEWRGKIFVAGIGKLHLEANRVDFNKSLFDINEIIVDRPVFRMIKKNGLWSARDSIAYWQPRDSIARLDTSQQRWNENGMALSIKKLLLTDGEMEFYNRLRVPSDPGVFDARDIVVTGIAGEIKNISFLEDSIRATVDIQAKERSGLEVKRMLADFNMNPHLMEFSKLDIQTNRSRLGNYYAMRYRSIESMDEFIDSVRIEARLQNSNIDIKDIGFFAPLLQSKNQVANVSGVAKGTISDFIIENLDLQTGNSRLTGTYSMKGLIDIDHTLINFQTPGSQLALNDVAVWAPGLLDLRNTPVGKLGVVNYAGNFSGTIYDFAAKGFIRNDLASLHADFKLKMDGPGKGYTGVITGARFDAGKLLSVPKLGHIAFDGVVSSNGFGAADPLKIKGKISTGEYAGYTYQDIEVNAEYQDNKLTAGLVLNDDNLAGDLETTLDFNAAKQRFNGRGIVLRADMKALGFMKDSVSFSGEFDVDFQGKTIDDFLGYARFYNAKITRDNIPLNFDSLLLQSTIDTLGVKRLSLHSNEAEALLEGKFNISDLKNGFLYFLHGYYPAIIDAPTSLVKNQDFNFLIKTKRVEPYLALLDSNLHGLDYAKIAGSLNTNTNELLINADVPVFGYKNMQVANASIKANGNAESLQVLGAIDNFHVNDSLNFPNAVLRLNTNRDTSHVLLSTSTNGPLGEARIDAIVVSYPNGFQLNFNESSFIVNSKKWTINAGGNLALSKGYVTSQGLTMVQDNQRINLFTKPSSEGNWNDLELRVENLNTADIVPYFVTDPRLEGLATGTVTISDPLSNRPHVTANMKIDRFVFNNDSVGIVNVDAEYVGRVKKLLLNVTSPNTDYNFKGKVAIDLNENATEQINATIPMQNMRLNVLKKYLGIVFDDLDGFASGELKLVGQLKQPRILGNVLLTKGVLKVDYTQCTYTIDSARLNFGYNYIDVGNIKLKDENGRTGTLNGRFYHHFFDSLSFNLHMRTDGMLILNTSASDNDLFYGKAVARATFDLTGPLNNLNMRITGTPTDSSHIYISNKTTRESGDADFVVFKTYGREMEAVYSPDQTNIHMNLDLNANPLCKVDVILDELTGDIIKATGTGNIKITTGTVDETVMRGRYNIEKGSYDYSFQTLIRKPFELSGEDENYIEWTGDPVDATLNIHARYNARKVSMSSLVGGSSNNTPLDQDARNAQGDVSIIARITGRLSAPTIDFVIEFAPNSALRNNLSAVEMLKRINEDASERLKQVTYLIIFKSFAPYKEGGNIRNPGADLAVNTISDLLSREMGRILTSVVQQITGDQSINVDINTNFYNSSQLINGTSTTTASQYDRVNFNFNLNKAYFNNRVVINLGSDFDVSVRNTNASGFQFLPDISVEFILTSNRRLRAIVFKRDNLDIGGRRNRAGASISYRKDFDKIIGNKKDDALLFIAAPKE